MNITITLSDGTTAHLQQLAKRQEGLRAQATRTLGNCVKEHLIRLNAKRPNALGGNRTNYYARAARATAINPQAGTVTIASRGFRYQLKGGTIRPSGRLSLLTGRPITRLAIPIHAKAHGKNPSDFGPLFLLKSKAENRAYLARTTGRGKNASSSSSSLSKPPSPISPIPPSSPTRTPSPKPSTPPLRSCCARSKSTVDSGQSTVDSRQDANATNKRKEEPMKLTLTDHHLLRRTQCAPSIRFVFFVFFVVAQSCVALASAASN